MRRRRRRNRPCYTIPSRPASLPRLPPYVRKCGVAATTASASTYTTPSRTSASSSPRGPPGHLARPGPVRSDFGSGTVTGSFLSTPLSLHSAAGRDAKQHDTTRHDTTGIPNHDSRTPGGAASVTRCGAVRYGTTGWDGVRLHAYMQGEAFLLGKTRQDKARLTGNDVPVCFCLHSCVPCQIVSCHVMSCHCAVMYIQKRAGEGREHPCLGCRVLLCALCYARERQRDTIGGGGVGE